MDYDYSFGDLVDCRKTNIGHFIVILGVDQKKHVLYKIVTSRVYKAFNDLRSFLDNCKQKGCQDFKHKFSKEKDNDEITKQVNLKDAFFLDQQEYSYVLTTDSLVKINSDVEKIDFDVLEKLRVKKDIIYRDKLTKPDRYKLKVFLEFSGNISEANMNAIGQSFNKVEKTLKK